MTTQEKNHFIYNCPKVGDYLVDDISKIPSGYQSYGCSCPHTKGVYAKRALLVAHIRRQPHRDWINNTNMTLHETKSMCHAITPETPIFVPEPVPEPQVEIEKQPIKDEVGDEELTDNGESYFIEEYTFDFLSQRIQTLEDTVDELKKTVHKNQIMQYYQFVFPIIPFAMGYICNFLTKS
mgnify:CR=1 FL=1|tara:strand:- start:1917 stop:2456 length:540 start_codon:yes stop_codon:yes gene_type:complete